MTTITKQDVEAALCLLHAYDAKYGDDETRFEMQEVVPDPIFTVACHLHLIATNLLPCETLPSISPKPSLRLTWIELALHLLDHLPLPEEK